MAEGTIVSPAPKYTAGGSDIFVAVYGSTSFADINAAKTAGNTVLAVRDNQSYLYAGTKSNVHWFCAVSILDGASFNYVSVTNGNVWGVGSTGIATSNSPSISGTATVQTLSVTSKASATESTDYTTLKFRNISLLAGTEPSVGDGANGDIWFVYE